MSCSVEDAQSRLVMRISKEAYLKMREHKNFPNVLALYSFYQYQAMRQNSAKIRATVAFCAKSLGWHTDNVRWIKKTLVNDGLIREISSNKSTDGNSYVLINFMEDHQDRTWVL